MQDITTLKNIVHCDMINTNANFMFNFPNNNKDKQNVRHEDDRSEVVIKTRIHVERIIRKLNTNDKIWLMIHPLSSIPSNGIQTHKNMETEKGIEYPVGNCKTPKKKPTTAR